MKNKKGLLIAIIVAVVVIAIAFVAVYFATDLFKTNKQLFYQYISKTQMMNPNFSKMYAGMNQKISENNYSSNGQLEVLATMPNIQTGNMDTQTIFSIKSNGLENKLLKQSYKDFTLSSNNQNLLTLKYLRDDNIYALGADNILAKYVAVENANLKELFTKFGVQDVSKIPDSLTSNLYEELLKIDNQTLESLEKNYYAVFYNNIKEENYYKISNQDGTETIGVSLSEAEVAQLVKIILETAKNDNVLLNFIVNKAHVLGYQDVTIQSIQESLQTLIDRIPQTTDTTSQDLGYMKLSFTKKGKQVSGIQLETKIEEEQTASEEEASQIETFDSTSISQTSNYSSIQIDISEANKMVVTIATQENDENPLIVTINYSYGQDGLEVRLQFEEKTAEGAEAPIPVIQLQYHLSGYQSDTITQNGTLVIRDQTDSQTSYQLNYTNQITLKQDVQIEKLTTENSAKLNDMTAEEIQQFMVALTSRMVALYGSSTMNAFPPGFNF